MKEIESLNLTEIDIEELEHRIELGQMVPMGAGVEAPFECTFFSCDTYQKF
jgi:hypothetical protein